MSDISGQRNAREFEASDSKIDLPSTPAFRYYIFVKDVWVVEGVRKPARVGSASRFDVWCAFR